MIDQNFIAIGEKIHCSRIFISGGKNTFAFTDRPEAIKFRYQGRDKLLTLPENWLDISPAYKEGKIKHVAVAVHIATNSDDMDLVETALHYLYALVESQIAAGAAYIDLNVDEYAADTTLRQQAMKWLAGTLAGQYADVKFSIDSSDTGTLAAGLEAASVNSQQHLCNSISLERTECIEFAAEFGSAVMASAAGEDTLPTTAEAKVENLKKMVSMLTDAGIPEEDIHLDPLVLPLSTGDENGRQFLSAVKLAASEFENCTVSGGLSNVSFGMPQRKLLNSVFVRMAIEQGCGGGIIDPVQTSIADIMAMDTESKKYQLAKNFLLGNDQFGMEFITAHREGRLD